jgi:uncharacterized NAD(P)/FAD-binding protein YdhS
LRPSSVIAVVGAGFSGVTTALHLLRRDASVKVVLIERRSPLGLGAAYATDNPRHRLNVRAGNMSAWPDEPDGFVDWLAGQGRGVGPGGFATRGDYGSYLQSLLAGVAEGPEAAGRLVITPDEITAITRSGDGWRLTCGMGRTLSADAVVLALGNPPPSRPEGVDRDFAESDLYVADPWRWEARVPEGDAPILLLGSGLTMVDVALALDEARPGQSFVALSRRGLTPLRHDGAPPVKLPPPPSPLAGPLPTLAWLRSAAERHGWRTAIDALRPVTKALWRGWSLQQRTRFLRHGRAFWDVHRHRLAPQVAAHIDHMRRTGRLRVVAGRLERVEAARDQGFAVTWRPRGSARSERFEAGLLVNCTGPAASLARSSEPLLASLSEQGLVRPDPLGLGVDVDVDHRVIAVSGQAQPTLFAVGPMTRGALWEINAVPDIRVQAVEVAQGVIRALR